MSHTTSVIAIFVLKFTNFRYQYHGNRVGMSRFLLTQSYWLSPMTLLNTKNYVSMLH